MSSINLHGRTILLTGAARGLGRQLALRLAVLEGSNLVLVDRNRQGLADLKAEIGARCTSAVRILAMDLLAEHCARHLYQELAAEEVFGLVNNAGLTFYGRTEAVHLDLFRTIIDLDFRLVVELSLLFLARFKEKGEGFILNVTSLGAFLPIPFQTVYAAAKAAAQSFSECLAEENRGSGVLISTVAPSGIVTEMIGDAGLTLHMHKHGYSYLSPEEAARQVVEGLKRGKRLIIPGGFNRLIYLLGSILPRRLVVRLAGNIYNYSKYGSSH